MKFDFPAAARRFVSSSSDPVHWISRDLKLLFGGRVRKVALDSGAACPNRDGTLGFGGCSFCDPGGSGPDDPVAGESWMHRLERLAAERGAAGVLAYFQAFSNTYGRSPGDIARMIERAAAVEGVVGAVLATRPDCLGEGILDVLERAADEICLWVELGMQTSNDATLLAVNRGHSHAATIEAVETLKIRAIPCVLHVVFGLPGEGAEDAKATINEVLRLAPWGIKIHPLLVLEGAALAKEWRRGELPLLSREGYVGMVVDAIEKLPPEMTIHRLTGERPEGVMLAPNWCFNKRSVLRAIEREMVDRGSFQGCGGAKAETPLQ